MRLHEVSSARLLLCFETQANKNIRHLLSAKVTLHIPNSCRRTHLFLEEHSVSAVTKFVSTLNQRCYQTELIFCGIRVILGGGGC